MKDPQDLRRTLLIAFLKGGAVVVVLIWSVLSFVPLVAIVYGSLSPSELVLNVIFATTGVLGVGALYAMWLLLAAPEARIRLTPDGRKVLRWLGIFASGWVLLFAIFG